MSNDHRDVGALRSTLISLGAIDVDSCITHLESISDHLEVAELVGELALAADVDLVLAQTEKLLENPLPGTVEMLNLPLARHRWIQLTSASRALSSFCIRHPELSLRLFSEQTFTWDFQSAMTDALKGANPNDEEFQECVRRLRLQYRLEVLKIAIADVADAASFETTALRLSELADATLEAALLLATRVSNPVNVTRMAVIAMGKTGGRELNYVSDVDLLFVIDESEAEKQETCLQEATRIAQMMMQIISSPQIEQPLWHIDANLRPEGKDGALVRTLSSYKTYYERWAETWEFQALMKARTMAGDQTVGEAFVKIVEPLIWKVAERENFVSDIQEMRKRVIANIPSHEAERELKLGVGGLRDIEFAIQLLQLVHGKTDEAIRSSNTLIALDSLMTWGYVGRDDAEILKTTYIFERQIEHRIQMFDMTRTHLLPKLDEDLRRLGKLLGFKAEPLEGVVQSLHQHRTNARRLHEKLFYKPLLQAVARVDSDVVRMSLESARARLRALGYQDADAALRHIQFLSTGLSRRAVIQRNLLPVVLAWMAETPNPDGGLLRFRNLSETLGETPWYLRLLRDESLVLNRLAVILSVSPYISSMIENNPEAMSLLGSDDSLKPSVIAELVLEMCESGKRQTNFTEALGLLRKIRQRELIRIATADMFHLLDTIEVMSALSDLTDASLQSALTLYRYFHPSEDFSIAIVGLGRYGGKEMSYGSDADIMVIFDAKQVTESATSYVTDFVSCMQRDLSAPLASPTLQVDLDLRPEGKNGPIARSFSSYKEYYENWSLTWESQALLRARFVAGDSVLGEKFIDLIDALRYPKDGLSQDAAREIRSMKARVESERLPRGIDPKMHIKLGPGGLSDIEWLVQFVQLHSSHQNPNLKTTSTLRVLDELTNAIGLSSSEIDDCKAAWIFASKLRNYLHLVDGKVKDVVSTHPQVRSLLGYLLGEQRPSDVLETWLRLSRRSRKIFKHVVYESPIP
ncbi:MAG: bifunctional [glutamine synthetase] adenylyltransferase/[glutamine synthetase]-adenylyl-L-tyrosine phosphorylase [Candidatus Nanopelagicales bacterium]